MTISIISYSLFRRCPVFAETYMISAYGIYASVVRISFSYCFMVLSFFSMASHLFTTMITPFPRSCAIPAILASCSVTPSVASITISTTSALSTAVTVRIILNLSSSSLILFFLRSPAVSIKIYSLSSCLIAVSMASLVVPAISDTITRFSPRSLLTIEDFPTFGFPTMAIFGRSSSSVSPAPSGKCETTSSSISPIPSLDAAEIGTGSPIPRL